MIFSSEEEQVVNSKQCQQLRLQPQSQRVDSSRGLSHPDIMARLIEKVLYLEEKVKLLEQENSELKSHLSSKLLLVGLIFQGRTEQNQIMRQKYEENMRVQIEKQVEDVLLGALVKIKSRINTVASSIQSSAFNDLSSDKVILPTTECDSEAELQIKNKPASSLAKQCSQLGNALRFIEGEDIVYELSSVKMVRLGIWKEKGIALVHIRDYRKEGKNHMPLAKGIALTLDVWNSLVLNLPGIIADKDSTPGPLMEDSSYNQPAAKWKPIRKKRPKHRQSYRIGQPPEKLQVAKNRNLHVHTLCQNILMENGLVAEREKILDSWPTEIKESPTEQEIAKSIYITLWQASGGIEDQANIEQHVLGLYDCLKSYFQEKQKLKGIALDCELKLKALSQEVAVVAGVNINEGTPAEMSHTALGILKMLRQGQLNASQQRQQLALPTQQSGNLEEKNNSIVKSEEQQLLHQEEAKESQNKAGEHWDPKLPDFMEKPNCYKIPNVKPTIENSYHWYYQDSKISFEGIKQIVLRFLAAPGARPYQLNLDSIQLATDGVWMAIRFVTKIDSVKHRLAQKAKYWLAAQEQEIKSLIWTNREDCPPPRPVKSFHTVSAEQIINTY